MDWLMITDKNKSRYVCNKDFDGIVCSKIKNKNKKYFCRYWFKSFSSENVLQELEKIYLKINGTQSVKLRSVSIKFTNRFKKLAVPFKI